MPEQATLGGVLDSLKRSGRDDAVSVGDVLKAFQHRSLGVLLTLLGLIVIMPIIGDIPGAALLCATLALVVIAQFMLGRGELWAPEFVRKREISRDRFDRGIDMVRPWIRWFDRLLAPRLGPLVAGRTQRALVSLAAAVLALALYPLAFVPFGANAPGFGLIALGLGLMSRDGLMVLIGYALAAVTIYLVVTAV